MYEIPKGHQCDDRADFDDLLRWWLDETPFTIIGDEASFGGKPWVHVVVGGEKCHLNADTSRAGVAAYLQLLDRSGGRLAWHVVPNSHGRVNKVVFGDDQTPVPHFYLYTDNEQPRSRTLHR